MRLFIAVLTLVFLFSTASAQTNDTTEGGNITELEMDYKNQTAHWAGIVGWLNGSDIDTLYPISFQAVNQSDVYVNEPNGSFSDYEDYLLMVTRLPFRPDIEDISLPSASDFGEGGMFDGFTTFSSLNTSSLPDGPQKTFCDPTCVYATCDIADDSFSCPFIVLNYNIPMAVLKFDNGTHQEPLFVTAISTWTGYNSSLFDFEFMVPTHEDYYFYIYEVEVVPPKPKPPSGPPSGGPAGPPIHMIPITPPPPPPPPPVSFGILPEIIPIEIDYPQEGRGDFILSSNFFVDNLSCSVVGDFSEYTTVEISEILYANATIKGKIIVNMSPTELLDYDRGTEGVLRCEGVINEELVSSTMANVYIGINEPEFVVEDESIEIMVGEEKEGTIIFYNYGAGNSTAINISAGFGAYAPLITITEITESLENGEMGFVKFVISVPENFEEGVYRTRVTIYENGRPLGDGSLRLHITAPPIFICVIPDIIWTILILVLGLLISIYLFRRKLRENEEELTAREKESKWRLYRKPLAYAAITMIIFIIIWLLTLQLFAKCV